MSELIARMREFHGPAVLALVLGLLPAAAAAQEPARVLTLEEAIQLAREGNAGLGAVRQKVEETSRRSAWTFTNYLPRISTQAAYMGTNNSDGLLFPAGSLGSIPDVGPFPPVDSNNPDVGKSLFFVMTTLAQPLTQYFQIREGLGVARADEDIARASLRKAEQDVDFGVLQAYAGVLIAQRGMEVARERVAAAELRLGYQTVSVSSGTAIDASEREARVRWLQGRQDLLEREGEFDDLSYKLADALGLPPGTRVELRVPGVPVMGAGSLEDFVADALRDNPDVLEARALVSKSTHGVGAAKAAYIPQIGILGGHVYQTSLPFFPKNMLAVGLAGSVTLFDFGARRNVVRERRAQLSQAEQNLEMVENRVRGEVEAAHRKLARAAEALVLAQEALELRSEGSRLRILQAEAGYAVPAQEREATAERLEAEMDFLRAQFGYRIAQAELGKASGSLGR